MNEIQLQKKIRDAADYIREKIQRDDWFTGRYKHPTQVETKRDEIKRRIDDVQAKAVELCKAMEPLVRDLELDLIQFDDIREHLGIAYDHALNSHVKLHLAQKQLPPPRTRKMEGQRTAVRLSYALVGETSPRSVRAIAKRIITEAGLDSPDERSLTSWIKETKKENSLG